jgi:hypothetical protein
VTMQGAWAYPELGAPGLEMGEAVEDGGDQAGADKEDRDVGVSGGRLKAALSARVWFRKQRVRRLG